MRILSALIVLGSVATSVWLAVGALVDPEALERRQQVQSDIATIENQNTTLRTEIEALRAEIRALKGREDVLERAIRDRLGYIKPGDRVLELPRNNATRSTAP